MQVLATNKTPAMSGGKYFYSLPLAGLSLQSQQAIAHREDLPPRRATQDSWVPLATLLLRVSFKPTVLILILLRVHTHTNTGRLTHLVETVFHVSGSFNNDDPPLWTQLVSTQARAQAFCDNKSQQKSLLELSRWRSLV